MSHQTWPPSSRHRAISIFMAIAVAAGYRRWISHPWQCSLRDYAVVVAICAAGMRLAGAPTPMIVVFTTLAVAAFACPVLAGHGFRLIDLAVLMAILLLAAAFMLPAVERTRSRTLGKRLLPFAVPARYLRPFSEPR